MQRSLTLLVIQKICSIIHEYWDQIQDEINPESDELDQVAEDDPERYKPKHRFDTFEKWLKSVEESYHNLHRVMDATMKVLPVNFATEHKQMLAHLHMLINKEYLAIPKEYDKLIISLRTAYANEYLLIKNKLHTQIR